MPRLPTRPALALLGTLLCLAACTPIARGTTATPTLMPARVPAGWKVLTAAHFRIAYPPDWTTFSMYDPKYYGADLANTGYYIATTDPGGHVRLSVSADANVDLSGYCPVGTPTTLQFQPTTLVSLPMHYLLVPYPNGGGGVRWWVFQNAQRIAYTLRASDGDASKAI